MEAIKVSDIIGTNFENEDAILLRNSIENNLNNDIELDFTGIKKVPTTFLYCLFTNLMNSRGRNYVASHIQIKNLANLHDLNRVLLGTAFNDEAAMI